LIKRSGCKATLAGLPDGIFSNQKSQIRYIEGDLGMENVGIFVVINNI
jgi:hypothetical protein